MNQAERLVKFKFEEGGCEYILDTRTKRLAKLCNVPDGDVPLEVLRRLRNGEGDTIESFFDFGGGTDVSALCGGEKEELDD